MKTSELIGTALDWAVAKCEGKVSRYTPFLERILQQSMPMSDGCRIWCGKLNQHGYGVCKVGGKPVRAHRAVYFHLNSEADQSLVVMHTCDVPSCVNPVHLQLGTVRDNMLDMVSKGRHNGGAPKGNNNAAGNEGWKKGGITAKYAQENLK